MERLDPHPLTGDLFPSPVPPGVGWPGDPATTDTPVAGTAAAVRRLAAGSTDVAELQARVSVCRACPRLVRWREEVARSGRRASFSDQPYWGRPGPSFGDPGAEVLLVGLAPAANGTNRTGPHVHRRLLRRLPVCRAAPHGLRRAADVGRVGRRPGAHRHPHRRRGAVRSAGERADTAEKETCSAWLRRDLELATPRLRAILCLGAIGWGAAVSRRPRSRAGRCPTPRPGSGMPRRCPCGRRRGAASGSSAVTTSARTTPSPGGSPPTCSTTCCDRCEVVDGVAAP